MMKTVLAVLLLAASLAEATAGQLPCAPPMRNDSPDCKRIRDEFWRRKEKPSIPLPTKKPAPTWWDCTPPGSSGPMVRCYPPGEAPTP
jgi:hypothetical protein